jgi:hypothetical protein
VTPEVMVADLTEYFSGSYSPKLTAELLKVCRNIDETDRSHICEIIREDNAPNFKVGVKAIADACRKIGIPYHKSDDYYVQAEDWTCDACGLSFKYAQVVSYASKHDKGIFDSCPRCGLPPIDTKNAHSIMRMQNGRVPDRYEDIKAQYMDSFQKRKKDSRYSGWIFDKQEEDDYMAQKRREEIEAMKAAARSELEMVTAARRV